MADELKDSGTVTAMSVVGFVFGLIGMLGSFIPCIGSLAFYIGIPAAIISGIALGVAYSQKAKRTFAIVAVTISLIGVVISGWQYFSIISAGKKAKEELERMSRTYAPPQPKSPQVGQPYEKPGPQIKELSSNRSGSNQVVARKLFYDAYLPLLKDVEKQDRIPNDSKWIKREILLPRGVANFVQIEMKEHDMYFFQFNKRFRQSTNCGTSMSVEWRPETMETGAHNWNHFHGSDEGDTCWQYIFEPFYEDTKLLIFIPKEFQDDFTITLKDARIVD